MTTPASSAIPSGILFRRCNASPNSVDRERLMVAKFDGFLTPGIITLCYSKTNAIAGTRRWPRSWCRRGSLYASGSRRHHLHSCRRPRTEHDGARVLEQRDVSTSPWLLWHRSRQECEGPQNSCTLVGKVMAPAGKGSAHLTRDFVCRVELFLP
jgi:hypothetical protein